MKRIIKVIGLPTAGFAIVLIGLVYDTFFAGIPYQDPTPEIQSRWEFHKSVADLFYKTGGIILLGLLAIPVVWIRTKVKCQQLITHYEKTNPSYGDRRPWPLQHGHAGGRGAA